MEKKKIFWIVLFAILVILAIILIANAKPQELKESTQNSTVGQKTNTNTISGEKPKADSISESTTPYQKIELSDGILYSIDGTQVEPEIVIGDNYFDTTINDIWLNPDDYKGKKIQIEGLYFASDYYTYVGRYSNSNVCQACPPGLAYFEYSIDGTIDRELKQEEDWIKIIGTLEVGNDETSDYTDYYFLRVLNIEIMNEKGQLTVNN